MTYTPHTVWFGGYVPPPVKVSRRVAAEILEAQQAQMLEHIRRNPGRMVASLADAMEIDLDHALYLLARLHKRGLIETDLMKAPNGPGRTKNYTKHYRAKETCETP